MGDQQRYFGRWLMPVFPIVAILGAYGAVELIRWLIRARRIPAPLAAGLVSVLLLAQSLIAVVHNDAVAVAAGHAQPDARLDGQPRPRRVEGRDRAGRRRQLGARHRHARCRGRRPASAGSATRRG